MGANITVDEGEDGQDEGEVSEAVSIRPINIPFIQKNGEKETRTPGIWCKTGFEVGCWSKNRRKSQMVADPAHMSWLYVVYCVRSRGNGRPCVVIGRAVRRARITFFH